MKIMYCLVKNPETRKHTLQWINTHILTPGRSRSGLHADMLWRRQPALHGSDGLFINLCATLFQLCKPFTNSVRSPEKLEANVRIIPQPLLGQQLY